MSSESTTAGLAQLNHQKLLKVLDEADDLPSIPSLAIKVYRLCSKDSTDKQELSEVLKSDQAMVAKLLRTVNSAYYGLRREINSISETIDILGLNGIKNAVMVSAAGEAFGNFPGSKALWLDSVEASLVVESLFEYFHKEFDDEQFLTALLHNIGRIVFAKYFPHVYDSILSIKDLERIKFEEQRLFLIDHRESGAMLAKNWDLPLNVICGIQGNHSSISGVNFIDLALAITYSSLEDLENNPELAQYVKIKRAAIEKKNAI